MPLMEKRKSEAMKKIVRYILILLVVAFTLYNSVYFKPLDEVKAAAASNVFDAKIYAADFWENKLMANLDQAVDLLELYKLLKSDPDKAFDVHSNALGIGNIRFFLVTGSADVMEIGDDHVLLDINADTPKRLATDYIFGNAIRDASRQIDINEFVNTMDFNNVSAEINELVVENVLPSFIQRVKVGDNIIFHGAIEMNKAHPQLDQIEIIPIQLIIRAQENL